MASLDLTSTGSQDYAHRLETDVNDVAALIKHLSPGETATVLGTSSGLEIHQVHWLV